MSLATNFQRFDAIGSDEPVRLVPASLPKDRGPVRFSAEQLLRRNHGRRPIRMDQGSVRTNFAALQEAAARRASKI